MSSGHYFTAQPTATSRPSTVSLVLPDLTLTLATDRGVFAADAVDAGTRLLLLEAPPLPDGPRRFLDLGCGYGPMAVTMAVRRPEATVWAVDVNERARALCAANAARAGVADRVLVRAPDEVGDVTFDVIWSNPPIRIGKAALHRLLVDWLGRLAAGGTAVLVVHQHLGADSLARWLRDRGWQVERLRSRAGFRLLQVTGP